MSVKHLPSPSLKCVVYCESVLGFDKSTPTHKILFIYKVHDITVLPLLLITLLEYISYNPSLLHNKPKRVLHKALVNISAIWTLVETYGVTITPSFTFS